MMGYFDGMTAALIRPGPDGTRYHAPLGKFGALYQVPDDAAAARLQGRWRGFYIALFGVMLVAVLATGADWRLILASPLAGLLAIPFARWAARDLPRATIAYADLPALSRQQALANYSRATGRRTLGIVLGTSIVMTAVGIVAAVTSGEATLWLSAAFFGLCTVSIYRGYQRAAQATPAERRADPLRPPGEGP